MGCPVVHWEIGAKDATRSHRFYGELFDWKMDTESPTDYMMVATGGEGGINGGIMQSPEGVPPYLTFYVLVDDLQAYLDRAKALGGKAVVPPTPIPDAGSFAMFTDPDGNMVGLFQE